MFKKGSPSSEDPLFSLENVILTPHMASNTYGKDSVTEKPKG